MDGVQTVRIENNIFSNNTKHGIRGYRIDGGGGPKDWVIVNNTFFANESPVKTTEDLGGHILFNNLFVDNVDNAVQMDAANFGSSSNLTSSDENAIFVNAASNDLRLKQGSPPVDTGISAFMGIAAPTDDLASESRTGIPDIGAFELNSDYPLWIR
jgi:hypothetical protein